MKNPFSYLFRARDKPQNAVSAAPSFYFGMSGSGKSVSPSSAIQVSAVYACVRVIAETIASLPFHVYEATDEGSRKAVEHPLYRLIHDEPNLEMTSFVWRETMLTHLLLYGNSYCQIIRTGRSQIDSLYPLLPDHMEVDRDSKGKAMVFGDMNYYWIADREGRKFQRLNELYAPAGQVGFLASQRVDGKLILPEAVKVLQMKAA